MLKNFFEEDIIEAGCDEAGRGCLAGPVFAAAVVLPPAFYHPLLNDSKQVSEINRNELKVFIEENALAYGVAMIEADEIDRINILKASFKAMHLATEKLSITPGLMLIDGNRFIKYKTIRYECIIKGDAIFASIAAASILAKTYRDEYMLNLHQQFPHYAWHTNKGYGTLEHRKAIQQHGQCSYHRKTFQCQTLQISLEID